MANNIITPSQIASEGIRIMHNASGFLGNVNTDYSDMFGKMGNKAGNSISIRRPVQTTIRTGATASIQDVNETSVTLTLGQQFGSDIAFQMSDLTTSIDDFSNRYIRPAASRIAAELDMKVGALYSQIAQFSGTYGTTPSTAQAVLDAGVLLDDSSCPKDEDRNIVVSPLAQSKLVGGMTGLFNDSAILSKQYKTGAMGSALGFDFFMSQNLPTHTVGGLGGTPLVNGANQGTINSGATDNPYATTTSLVTDGWTAAVANRLKAGDVITIAGVTAVNPETKVSTGVLKQFVVTADVSSDVGGNATIVISPAIIAGGAYQNVTARPLDNVAISVISGAANTTYKQNILFHRDAITLVTVDLELPTKSEMAARERVDGVSLRFIKDYDVTNDRQICRFDMLAGFALLRPEWAVRLTQ